MLLQGLSSGYGCKRSPCARLDSSELPAWAVQVSPPGWTRVLANFEQTASLTILDGVAGIGGCSGELQLAGMQGSEDELATRCRSKASTRGMLPRPRQATTVPPVHRMPLQACGRPMLRACASTA